MTKTWIAVVASLTLAACSKQEPTHVRTDTPPNSANPMPPAAGKTAPATTAKDTPAKPIKADTVLVEVNGKKLAESTALLEANRSVAAANKKNPIPPGSVEQVRQRAIATVMDVFVTKTLMSEEAVRQGLTATPEEEQQALDRLQKTLPPGKTLSQMLRENATTEQQVRQELSDRIRIMKLLSNAVPAVVSMTTEELDAYMAQHEKELTTPETVHARHILLATGTNNTDEAKAERRKAADAVREELVKGGDFAELAKQRSDCPSRAKGGDLGTFARGRMTPPFEEAAFKQDVGTIGDVVETSFGYHIIEVLEHKQAERIPREKVQAFLEQQKKAVALDSWMNGLKAKATITYSPTAPRLPKRPAMPGMQP